MENPRAGRWTPTALMLGNLVTGCSLLAFGNLASAFAPDYASLLVMRLGRSVRCTRRRPPAHDGADPAGGAAREHDRVYLPRLIAHRLPAAASSR